MYRVKNAYHHLIEFFSRISFYAVISVLFLTHFSSSNEQKTKLCADPKCENDLFSSSFIRAYDSPDHSFLKAQENASVKIVAFGFSDRPDLLEAEDDQGKKGLIYDGHIDQMPYVIFLESALKSNQTLYMVDRTGDWPKVIREVSAIPELFRMYTTYAAKLENYALDKHLVAQLMQHDELQKKPKAHRHNHHPNAQQQPKSNNNIELRSVKDDRKVVDNTNKENANDATEKREQSENAMDKMKQNPNGDVKNRAVEKPANIEQQKQQQPIVLKPSSSPEKTNEEMSSTYDAKNAESAGQTSAANKQQNEEVGQQIVQPSEKKPPPQQSVQNSPSKIPTTQNQLNQQVPFHNQLGTQPNPSININQPESSPNPSINNNQPESNPNPSININQPESKPIQKQTEQSPQVPPNQPQLNPNHQQPSPLEAQPNPSINNNQPESNPNPSINNNQPESNPIQKQTEQSTQVPPNQPQLNPNNQQPSPLGTQPNPSINNTDQSSLKEPNQPQQNIQTPPPPTVTQQIPQQSSEIKAKHTEQQDNSFKLSQEKPPELDSTIEENNAGDQKLENALPMGKSDDLHQKKIVDQPQERPSSISGDAVPAQKSIGTGTPTDESFTTQHNGITPGKKEEESATKESLDVSQKENELQREKSIDNEHQTQQQKYCFKEDCQEFQHQPLSSPSPSALRRMFREWMTSVRTVLPEPLCHFEDTGLIVLAFIIVSIVLHLTNLLFSSVSGPEPFNNRLLHDCITRLKEQELIIKKANKNAAINQHLAEAANAADYLQKQNEELMASLKSVEKRATELETDNANVKHSLKQAGYELEQRQALVAELKASVETKDAELKMTNSAHQRVESELTDALSKLAQSENKEKYLEQDLKEAQLQMEHFKLELSKSQTEVAAKRSECAEKSAEIDELLGVVAELNRDQIEGKRKTKKEGRRKSQQQLSAVEQQNVDHSGSSAASSPGQNTSLLEAVEMDTENGAGSGGSAGWSDLGDGTEVPGADSEPSGGKLLDILELAKLKSRLRSLETERDHTKLTIKVAQEEKEHFSKEVERLRQELVERERDSEQRELDRHGLTQQCTKLLQMIEEKEKKLGHTEHEREKLRTRCSEAELRLLRVEDEKRELLHRIKELEQSLKHSNELNGRLENKIYHEERRLNTKIRHLDEQLAFAKGSLSPLNMSGGGVSADLNMSANSSDSPSGVWVKRARAIPSLWSEIDSSEAVDSSSFASVRSANVPRQRMRSRSVGRQSVRSLLVDSKPNVQLHKPTPK